MDTHHPCGALPVVGLNLSAWWCQTHQARWGTGYVYRQDATTGDEPLVIVTRALELGPFDGPDELQPLATSTWVDWLNASV